MTGRTSWTAIIDGRRSISSTRTPRWSRWTSDVASDSADRSQAQMGVIAAKGLSEIDRHLGREHLRSMNSSSTRGVHNSSKAAGTGGGDGCVPASTSCSIEDVAARRSVHHRPELPGPRPADAQPQPVHPRCSGRAVMPQVDPSPIWQNYMGSGALSCNSPPSPPWADRAATSRGRIAPRSPPEC